MLRFTILTIISGIFAGCQLRVTNPEALKWYVEQEHREQEHRDYMRSKNRLQRLPTVQPSRYYQNNNYGSPKPTYNPYDPVNY